MDAYMTLVHVAFWATAFAMVCVLVWSKPTASPQPAPEDAATIGPDGYMKVWESGGRINMRFRNMPNHTVKFDRRAAGELAAWLEGVK
jgi:hypothetical protein